MLSLDPCKTLSVKVVEESTPAFPSFSRRRDLSRTLAVTELGGAERSLPSRSRSRLSAASDATLDSSATNDEASDQEDGNQNWNVFGGKSPLLQNMTVEHQRLAKVYPQDSVYDGAFLFPLFLLQARLEECTDADDEDLHDCIDIMCGGRCPRQCMLGHVSFFFHCAEFARAVYSTLCNDKAFITGASNVCRAALERVWW